MKRFEGKENILFAIFFTCYLAALAVWGINREHWHDEYHFVKTIHYFGKTPILSALYNYEEMSTPLPFLTYALWGKMTGFQLPHLRIFSLIIAFCTYLAIFSFFKRHLSQRTSLFAVVFLACIPYFAGASIFVFTDMMAILFLALAFLAAEKRKPVLLSISLAAAVLSRQYFIFLVPPFFFFYALRLYFLKNRSEAYFAIGTLLSCIPLGALFLYWGGSCPVNETQKMYVSNAFLFHPEFLSLYIGQIFLYALPFTLYYWKKFYLNRRILVSSLILSSFYLISPIKPSAPAIEVNKLTVGYFHRFLTLFLNDTMIHVVFYLCFLLALPLLLTFIFNAISNFRNRNFSLVFLSELSLLFFLITMSFSYLLWEKYFIPILPLVLFLQATIPMQHVPSVQKDSLGNPRQIPNDAETSVQQKSIISAVPRS